jgi:ATP-dependent helicase/nuclease subunit A
MTLHNPEQIIASNPEYSVWVSASAGTGKTKILTDRVLRLLLEDTPIDKILCLTFTNAAASEMTNRITDTLLKWQTDTESLKIVLGRAPTERELQKAKVLFAELNLSPQQLSIHTIHSFSQKILQRFPFEAGLHPGFSVLSDNEAMELIDLVLMDVGDVIAVESHEIHKSIMFLLQNLHENIFLSKLLSCLTGLQFCYFCQQLLLT